MNNKEERKKKNTGKNMFMYLSNWNENKYPLTQILHEDIILSETHMNVVYHTHIIRKKLNSNKIPAKSNETIAFLIPLDYNNPKKKEIVIVK